MREEDENEDETFTDTVRTDANVLQAVVVKTVSAGTANNTDHFYHLATLVENDRGKVSADDVVGDEINRGICTEGEMVSGRATALAPATLT